MSTIIDRYPPTHFATAAAAAAVADRCAADDDDCSYTVTPSGVWFVIIVRDNLGVLIGTL